MFKVISFNVNGIRAAAKKNFFEWLVAQQADVVCLQEVRAQESQLKDSCYFPTGYHCYYQPAQRPGYSGVAIYSRHQPKAVHTELGWACADEEGRYIQIDFDGLAVTSLYMPSGTSGDERQTLKYEFMDRYLQHLRAERNKHDLIVCGDWNIAHKKIDIKNWRANQKNSGFLPEERAWMDQLFGPEKFVDAFRVLNQEEHQYTWWSNRGRAWDNNVGWRIDYHVITPGLASKVQQVAIYKTQRFSDHAPLIVEYDWQF